MPRPQGPPEVEAWLRRLFHPEDVPDDEVNAATVRWLRGYFERAGAVELDVAWEAMVAHQVDIANVAVASVLDDLDRTWALRPKVVVDVWMERSIRISIDGSYTTPSMWALEQYAATTEVAEYFQEQLDQSLRCWPECERHNAGLHAEVRDGKAVWSCRLGRHLVAAIGELGLAGGRRRLRK